LFIYQPLISDTAHFYQLACYEETSMQPLDLGCSSHVGRAKRLHRMGCILDESGSVLLEQRLSTTAKALREVFGAMPRSRVALETGTHSPWISRLLSDLGHEVIRGACQQGAADWGES
jgi:hypothetical protein